MLLWLASNWGTLLAAAVLLAAVAAVVCKLIRDKRAGRHACGCSCGGKCGSCAGCAACGSCGGAQN